MKKLCLSLLSRKSAWPHSTRPLQSWIYLNWNQHQERHRFPSVAVFENIKDQCWICPQGLDLISTFLSSRVIRLFRPHTVVQGPPKECILRALRLKFPVYHSCCKVPFIHSLVSQMVTASDGSWHYNDASIFLETASTWSKSRHKQYCWLHHFLAIFVLYLEIYRESLCVLYAVENHHNRWPIFTETKEEYTNQSQLSSNSYPSVIKSVWPEPCCIILNRNSPLIGWKQDGKYTRVVSFVEMLSIMITTNGFCWRENAIKAISIPSHFNPCYIPHFTPLKIKTFLLLFLHLFTFPVLQSFS